MSIKGTLSDCIHQAVEEWNARVSAGPKTYQQVATVTPLHTLSKGMQDVISQLCTAVNSEKTRAPYVRRFSHHVIFDEKGVLMFPGFWGGYVSLAVRRIDLLFWQGVPIARGTLPVDAIEFV